MKKLIAAALTGALVLGTVGTSVVFAADDDKTITVAASETPHSEILEAAKPILEEEGYDLEVRPHIQTVKYLLFRSSLCYYTINCRKLSTTFLNFFKKI